jgi:hypothetical protein
MQCHPQSMRHPFTCWCAQLILTKATVQSILPDGCSEAMRSETTATHRIRVLLLVAVRA